MLFQWEIPRERSRNSKSQDPGFPQGSWLFIPSNGLRGVPIQETINSRVPELGATAPCRVRAAVGQESNALTMLSSAVATWPILTLGATAKWMSGTMVDGVRLCVVLLCSRGFESCFGLVFSGTFVTTATGHQLSVKFSFPALWRRRLLFVLEQCCQNASTSLCLRDRRRSRSLPRHLRACDWEGTWDLQGLLQGKMPEKAEQMQIQPSTCLTLCVAQDERDI